MDDRTVPYSLLGHLGDPENYENGVSIRNIQTFTCPLPEKVFLRPLHARQKAMEVCKRYLSEIKKTGTGPYITRLFVTTSASFKKRKLDAAISSPDYQDKASTLVTNLHLPHFVWVMEVSPLSVYQQRLCTAEIVLDATVGLLEKGIIYARIGNKLEFAGTKSVVPEAPTRFPQYTHNLGER
jgi:hypothetical protein